MTNDVRAAIRERHGKALRACEDLTALDREIRAAHPISAKGGGRLAVVFLHAKARKTFGAILLLAREGYGEDAMILARSLTNVCIDLAYLTAADTPERVRVWLASARIQLRRWATSLGRTLQADTVNWDEEEELAKKWLNLAERAARSDTQNSTTWPTGTVRSTSTPTPRASRHFWRSPSRDSLPRAVRVTR